MAITLFEPPEALRLAARPQYRLYFVDDQGEPVTAYADSEGALAHAYPVVLDRFGQFPSIYVDDEEAFEVLARNEYGVALGGWELAL